MWGKTPQGRATVQTNNMQFVRILEAGSGPYVENGISYYPGIIVRFNAKEGVWDDFAGVHVFAPNYEVINANWIYFAMGFGENATGLQAFAAIIVCCPLVANPSHWYCLATAGGELLCGNCYSVSDKYCLTFESLPDDACDCDALNGIELSQLYPDSLEPCIWGTTYQEETCGITITFSWNINKWKLEIYNSRFFGLPTVDAIYYSETDSTWDCSEPIILTRYAVAVYPNRSCDWPTTVTVTPCGSTPGSGATQDCYYLTDSELEEYQEAGYTIVSGPHDTEEECVAICNPAPEPDYFGFTVDSYLTENANNLDFTVDSFLTENANNLDFTVDSYLTENANNLDFTVDSYLEEEVGDTIWQDSFTDTDNTALASHTPDIGTGYTEGNLLAKIVGNKLIEDISEILPWYMFDPTGTDTEYTISFDFSPNESFASMDSNNRHSDQGVAVRVDAGGYAQSFLCMVRAGSDSSVPTVDMRIMEDLSTQVEYLDITSELTDPEATYRLQVKVTNAAITFRIWDGTTLLGQLVHTSTNKNTNTTMAIVLYSGHELPWVDNLLVTAAP